MLNLLEILYEALTKYFTVIRKTGYINDEEINNLLTLIFILEFLEENRELITELDYTYINKILMCLFGSSCLLPYSEYTGYLPPTPPLLNQFIGYLRLDELSVNRFTEDELTRIVEFNYFR